MHRLGVTWSNKSRRGSGFKFIEIVGPDLHYAFAFFDEISSIVCPTQGG